MKWRLNEDSKIIVPGSVTDNWYFFNGHNFEQVTPTVNGDNLEFTVGKNKAVVSLIRTNFDVLDTTQRYGKIKAERILSNLKISNNINAHRVTGDNLLTDGSFEEWDDANHLTHWSESVAGETTVNQETSDVIDGNYAIRVDVDASSEGFSIVQSNILQAGIYKFSIYAKITNSDYQYRIIIKDKLNELWWNGDAWQSSSYEFRYSNTEWEQKTIIFVVPATTTITVYLQRYYAPSQSIYFDNAKLEKIGVIEQYDARGGLKVVSDGTSVKKYAIDSQGSKQAELEKVWM